MSLRRHQPLTSDPHRQRAMRERGAKRYEERLREEGKRVRDIGTNEARRRRERERAYGPPERREWVRTLPSVASGRTPCVNAHVPADDGPSGMGRKADARWVVPLTLDEEKELHRIGLETFQCRYLVDLQAEARKVEEAWRKRSA